MASRGISGGSIECQVCGKRGHTIDTCFRIHKCQICGKHGHLTSTCYQNPEYKSQQVSSQNRFFSSTGPSPACQICSKKGHTGANCFYRIDVPGYHPSLCIPTCQICGLQGHVALNCIHRTNFAYKGSAPPASLSALTAHSAGSYNGNCTQFQGGISDTCFLSSVSLTTHSQRMPVSGDVFHLSQLSTELMGNNGSSDIPYSTDDGTYNNDRQNSEECGGGASVGLNSEANGDGDIDGLCYGDNDIAGLNDIDANVDANTIDSGAASNVNADVDGVNVNSNIDDLSNVVVGNESEETSLLQQLFVACLVVDALEASEREAVVNNFCSRKLTSSEQIFGVELTKLDKTEQRYAWIKRRMRTTDEIWKFFPVSWHVSYRLCIQLCNKTRKQLKDILYHQKEKPDVGILLLALQQILEFEDDLVEKFGSGTRGREVGNEIKEIGREENTTQSASDIRKKCEKKLAAHQENATEEKDKELSVLGAGFNFISSCLEPHLTVYTELEVKTLMENLEKLVYKETWDIEESELIYAYATIDRLADIEEFILMPNVVNLQNVSDRLYDESLYKAVKIIYTFISSWAKLIVTLLKLNHFQDTVDAARKVNSAKTQKEGCSAYVDAEVFRLAQICGLNIVIQVDDLEEVCDFYKNRGCFNELISLMDSDLGLECVHMKIFIELGVLYGRYHPETLMEHIKLFAIHLNIPKLRRACDEQQHWKELMECAEKLLITTDTPLEKLDKKHFVRGSCSSTHNGAAVSPQQADTSKKITSLPMGCFLFSLVLFTLCQSQASYPS